MPASAVPNLYTSITIDQPAKVYLWSRVGAWLGGPQAFSQSDVSMMIGNNPLTSHYAWQGSVPPFSPSRRLRDAKARGLKLICIDPRRTMVAQLADIHLQVRPGEDATLLAAMLKVILDEGLHDREFCAAHVAGLDELRASIDGFTSDYAARRADVPGLTWSPPRACSPAGRAGWPRPAPGLRCRATVRSPSTWSWR